MIKQSVIKTSIILLYVKNNHRSFQREGEREEEGRERQMEGEKERERKTEKERFQKYCWSCCHNKNYSDIKRSYLFQKARTIKLILKRVTRK